MKSIYGSEISIRKHPKNLAPEDEYLFRDELRKELPAVYVDQHSNAFLFPSGHLFKGLCFDVRQGISTIGLKGIVRAYIKSIVSLIRLRQVHRIKEAYFFTNSYSTNFFHWFLDALPKLEFQSRELAGDAKDHVFVVPSDHRLQFIIDSLRAFDFKFVIQKKNQFFSIDCLIFLPDIAPTGNYRSKEIKSLRDRLRSRLLLNQDKKAGNKKVYITRANAKKRKIVNESDLLPILRETGFSIIDMDRLTFKEQIEAMHNAEILVSLHGAGLTHMIWMKNSASVLEIRSRGDHQNNCYFALASDLDFDYYYVLADKLDPSLNTQQADYSIDPIYFKNQLLRILT